MQPKLQRIERLDRDDQLAVEDELFDRQMTRSLDHFGEVASEGSLADRDCRWTSSPSRNRMHRKPSYLGSNSQPVPLGSSATGVLPPLAGA